MLVFDDPGDAKGKSNQLDPSIILNLANNNCSHSLPVKFDFMNLKRGQIAIVSNRQASDMFPPESLEDIKTRLLTVQFTLQDNFPLKGESHLSKPFLYDENLAFKLADVLPNDDFIPLQSDDDNQDDDYDDDDDDDDVDDHDDGENEDYSSLLDNTYDQDLLFNILWRAILKILKGQLSAQPLSTLKYYVPNKQLRNLIKNKGINCIYEIICRHLTEQDLLNFLLQPS